MNTEILSYIPQRPPFVMIGELLQTDAKTTRTTYTIPKDSLFVRDGFFSESGMVENMAQTAAAGIGYITHTEGKPTQTGYIAALKNMQVISLARSQDTIETEITFVQTLLNFHLVKGKVFLNGGEIANCEFKIFVNPEQQEQTAL